MFAKYLIYGGKHLVLCFGVHDKSCIN